MRKEIIDQANKDGYKILYPLIISFEEVSLPSGTTFLHVGAGQEVGMRDEISDREPDDCHDFFKTLINMYVTGAITEAEFQKAFVRYGLYPEGFRKAKRNYQKMTKGAHSCGLDVWGIKDETY